MPIEPRAPRQRVKPLPTSNLTNTKAVSSGEKERLAKERSASARGANPNPPAATSPVDPTQDVDSSDDEGAHKAPPAAAPKPPSKSAAPPKQRKPAAPSATELQPAAKPEYQRCMWAERHESSTNSIFADEPAFVNPLNDSLPLQVRTAHTVSVPLLTCPTNCSALITSILVQGTKADLGRFVLLPVSAYPLLKESDRNGKEHVGWSVKILEIGARGSTMWLGEKGQSPTGFPPEKVKEMVLLSA